MVRSAAVKAFSPLSSTPSPIPPENGRTRVLILSGTTEGSALAQRLVVLRDLDIISSLAGRTSNPVLPPGRTRIGGFGGPAGLTSFIRQNGIEVVIDATHPFASRMGWNAAQACATAEIPLLRLERPAWRREAGDLWTETETLEQAATSLEGRAKRVLLAIGRQELMPFVRLKDIWFLIRSVEVPEARPLFAQAEFLLAKGPFALEHELTLLSEKSIDTIVCKNSGGNATYAKLMAARQLGIRVVIKQRPARPRTETVPTVADAVAWIQAFSAQRRKPQGS